MRDSWPCLECYLCLLNKMHILGNFTVLKGCRPPQALRLILGGLPLPNPGGLGGWSPPRIRRGRSRPAGRVRCRILLSAVIFPSPTPSQWASRTHMQKPMQKPYPKHAFRQNIVPQHATSPQFPGALFQFKILFVISVFLYSFSTVLGQILVGNSVFSCAQFLHLFSIGANSPRKSLHFASLRLSGIVVVL